MYSQDKSFNVFNKLVSFLILSNVSFKELVKLDIPGLINSGKNSGAITVAPAYVDSIQDILLLPILNLLSSSV